MNCNFVLILLGNAILGAPMPMLIILGGLAGVMLAPTPELAILPVSLQLLAGMLSAMPMSVLMGRYGRKSGFLLGALCAGLGGFLGAYSLFVSNFLLLCMAHAMLGAALSCFGFFRFAAAEVVSESWRPTAISITLGSGLVAAIIGPEIFVYTRDYFTPVPFAGGYGAISVISLIGCLPIIALSFPKAPGLNTKITTTKAPIGKILCRQPVYTAVICAAVSFGVMVLLMAPTPLAMVSCGFSETQASDVIRWHVIAMFAPSFFTGSLISRYGSARIVACGLFLLGLAGGMAATGIELEYFYISLILLGLGWNFGFIGATNMLSENLLPAERALVQGANDTLVALVATLASFGSGVLISTFDWGAVALAAFPMVFLALVLLYVLKRRMTFPGSELPEQG
ncbi:MFS transporter [Kiloniella laminariae]|uniref:MFS transporter n=1 Tax=Kiloniella laminariae TaxID=454162 RepID=A0ABT4LMS5_9PROT|nr:MFS transporter [Kiloniella laminariae]MCZ4282414.1 MFS transporter [Kiloniella laminariae]